MKEMGGRRDWAEGKVEQGCQPNKALSDSQGGLEQVLPIRVSHNRPLYPPLFQSRDAGCPRKSVTSPPEVDADPQGLTGVSEHTSHSWAASPSSNGDQDGIFSVSTTLGG